MSDSRTTATPETTNASWTAHPPVRENQQAIEAEVEQDAIAGQRVMRSVGGGSPETPPEHFSGALGGMSGRSQTGMLRQLQRSYGNSYVGSVIQRKADGNGTCTDCEKKEKEIQRKGEGEVGAVPDGFEATMQRSGTGQPLDEGTRSFMESRFGQDFGDVKVHTDSAAAEAAKQIQAQAFTTRRDIYFGRGRYQPEATEGKKLLAHELAHTVQQNNLSNTPTKSEFSSFNDSLERSADDTAAKVVSDSMSQINTTASSLTNPVIQREPDSSPDSRSESYKPLQPGQPQPSGGGSGFGMNFQGSCSLKNGTMKYSLVPSVGLVKARIEFIPNPIVAAANRTISFIQTMASSIFDNRRTMVDQNPNETDPFYGAEWNRATGNWGDEGGNSRPFTVSTGSAVVEDTPMLNIDEGKQFNTVAVVVESGMVLGSLSWNIQRWSAPSLWGLLGPGSSTIVRRADCAEGASNDFQTVVENFYSGNGNVVIDGFAVGSADLPVTYRQKLAPIVDRLRKEPNLKVTVGGAATHDEANPSVLSRLRADRVRAYLVSEGINESRINVESYGADWARVPVTSPDATNANRRVQIVIIK